MVLAAILGASTVRFLHYQRQVVLAHGYLERLIRLSDQARRYQIVRGRDFAARTPPTAATQAARERFEDSASQLRSFIENDLVLEDDRRRAHATLEGLGRLQGAFDRQMRSWRIARDAGDEATAARILADVRAAGYVTQARAIYADAIEHANRATAVAVAGAERVAASLWIVAIAVPILFALFLMMLFLGIRQSLTRSLDHLKGAAHRVADGDLDVEVAPAANRDFDELGAAFNHMVRELRDSTVSRAYLDNILHSMADLLFVLDTDGRIALANPGATGALGYREDELIGEAFWDRVIEHGPDTLRRIRDGAGNQRDVDATFFTKSGDRIPVAVSSAVLRCNREADGLVIVAKDIAHREQAREELERSRAQLRVFAGRLQSIREEERRRIARDLHDQLAQELVGLHLDVNWLASKMAEDRHEAEARLGSMRDLIARAMSTVRRVASELRPALLDHLGLVPAAQSEIGEFERRTGIRCRFDSGDGLEVDRAESLALFRVLQEALTNVARHASATSVDVVLAIDAGVLALDVHDDGRGITEAELTNAGSLGLLGIRERIHAVGGTVRIDGGHGTTLRVEIPQSAGRPAPTLSTAGAPAGT